MAAMAKGPTKRLSESFLCDGHGAASESTVHVPTSRQKRCTIGERVGPPIDGGSVTCSNS
jgi:hypothetical protein